MSDHVRYSLDAVQSQFTVHAFASGLAAVVAHNPKFAIRDFSGEAQFVPDTLRDASIQVRIKAASLELMDEVSEYDRGEIDRVMFNEVLEVSRFPEIVYTSTQIPPHVLARIYMPPLSRANSRSMASPMSWISLARWSSAKTPCAVMEVFR